MSLSGTFQLASVVKTLSVCRRCKRWQFSPWSGRSPGVGNGNPLQNSCPGNPTGREAWQAAVHGVAKSETQLGSAQHQSLLCTAVGMRTRLCLWWASPAAVHHAAAQVASSWADVPGQCSREGVPGPELKADLSLQPEQQVHPELEGFHKPSENQLSHSFNFNLLNVNNDAEILFYFFKYI